ncbi:DUF7344 domain-containing protein [Halosimplex sp. J119]
MTRTDGSLKYSNKSLAYDALSSPRRRAVVRVLDDTDGSLPLRELAVEVAREEAQSEDDTDEDDRIERIQTTLYHVHVPKLADAGIVRYREESERVTLTHAVSLDAIDVLGD